MSFSVNNFEELPDEILLLIFGYLSSTDILFSFYGLNNRLSRTISGFSKHVVLGEVSFQRFNYICTSILPNIGINIHSLVVSNDWKGVLSKIFLNHFGEKMSSSFPHLKCIIMPTYRLNTLISFIECLHDLPELFEIKIMSLYDMGDNPIKSEQLLDRIFTANNNRLSSIVFDDDSLHFSYRNNTIYFNIEKLVIEMNTVADLHRLLTSLPQLKLLDVTTNQGSFDSSEQIELSVALNLIYFRLRSYSHYWTLKTLITILKRIPNIEELIIQINTNRDTRLFDGQEISPHLPSLSLKKFSYFLQYEDLFSFDETNILSNWEQFNQEFICLKIDNENTLIFFTIPFNVSHVFLQYPLAENKIFSDNYASQLRFLTLYKVSTRLGELFPILNKCHHIQRLCVRVDDGIEPRCSKPVALHKLPYLTFFVSLDEAQLQADDFQKLIEASPNLYHLAVNYNVLQAFFDNESLCHLLEHRITHLLISISDSITVQSVADSISHFSSIFPSLKHFYFHPLSTTESTDPLILSVFQHLPEWRSLVSFGIANAKLESETVAKGIRQWVIENTSLNDEDSFLTDYSDNTFRLWL